VLQPVGAAVAFLTVEAIRGLLAISFAFAAGAMLALVTTDLLPRPLHSRSWRGPSGGLVGAGIMFALSAVLGV
jgi:zinc transporter ZupT